MRFRLLAFLTALLVVLAPASGAAAMEEWCEDDPLVLVTTPRGALGVVHLPAVTLTTISYTVQPADGGRATRVKMIVRVPNDAFGTGFKTRTTASSGPLKTGTIFDRASGVSGKNMYMSFVLRVP